MPNNLAQGSATFTIKEGSDSYKAMHIPVMKFEQSAVFFWLLKHNFLSSSIKILNTNYKITHQTTTYLTYPAKLSTAIKTTYSIIKIKNLNQMAHT